MVQTFPQPDGFELNSRSQKMYDVNSEFVPKSILSLITHGMIKSFHGWVPSRGSHREVVYLG